MRLDHVVLWVDDPERSLAFFVDVVGLTGVRVDEFRAGRQVYVSVRIDDNTIIDLFPRAEAERINAIPGAAGTAGHPTNHVCLAMSERELGELQQRLASHGTKVGHFMERQFGARGIAPRAFYFRDLDNNVLEARYYAD
jgi:catechol 2,3-dioxygenase-like lactoylglutathione lyase family enzyme